MSANDQVRMGWKDRARVNAQVDFTGRLGKSFRDRKCLGATE